MSSFCLFVFVYGNRDGNISDIRNSLFRYLFAYLYVYVLYRTQESTSCVWWYGSETEEELKHVYLFVNRNISSPKTI